MSKCNVIFIHIYIQLFFVKSTHFITMELLISFEYIYFSSYKNICLNKPPTTTFVMDKQSNLKITNMTCVINKLTINSLNYLAPLLFKSLNDY